MKKKKGRCAWSWNSSPVLKQKFKLYRHSVWKKGGKQRKNVRAPGPSSTLAALARNQRGGVEEVEAGEGASPARLPSLMVLALVHFQANSPTLCDQRVSSSGLLSWKEGNLGCHLPGSLSWILAVTSVVSGAPLVEGVAASSTAAAG